jgi:hypothetical protein
MQNIKPRKRAPPGPNFLHGGLVALAPGIGEAMRVYIAAPMPSQKDPRITRNAIPPIHHRAENVEDQRLHFW